MKYYDGDIRKLLLRELVLGWGDEDDRINSLVSVIC